MVLAIAKEFLILHIRLSEVPYDILVENPAQLPTSEACPACCGNLKQMGESMSEQLEYVPASFRVIRHVSPKLACACCDAIVQGPAASRPLERGLAGPSHAGAGAGPQVRRPHSLVPPKHHVRAKL
jgi:hypothetical protein